jgi:TPR repeat protein
MRAMDKISNSSQRPVCAAAAAALVSFVLSCPVSWAGFDEGQAAFNSKDYVRAMHEWGAAAEQGDARAQYHLAILYEQGLGTEKNIPEAFKWARLAAENGEANAQFALSVLYARGDEVAKDLDEAAKWFHRGVASARSGDSTAQYLLSKMYEAGRGVEKDDGKALTWLRSSAQSGNAAAQSELGERYARGHGVVGSESDAEEWLSKAAAQGEIKAIRLLLPMLKNTFESAKDDVSAVKALRKAAELDDSSAQYLLGMSYRFGRGVARDPVQACTWLILSGLTPEQLATRMDGIDFAPTAEQIHKAGQAAAAWKQAHPNLPPRGWIDDVPAISRE